MDTIEAKKKRKREQDRARQSKCRAKKKKLKEELKKLKEDLLMKNYKNRGPDIFITIESVSFRSIMCLYDLFFSTGVPSAYDLIL